jgi:hypothetical protein
LKSIQKHRARLAIVAPLPLPPHSAFGDRIAEIAQLGIGTISGERCAIAFQASGLGADPVIYSPPGDSRWDTVVNAVLVALDNRLADTIAARGTKRPGGAGTSRESINRISLSARETAALASVERTGEGHQLAASAFTDGVSAVRIAMVARADRDRGELEALLELMAHAVLSEIALGAARGSLEFWRTHGAENGRQAVGAKRELVRERGIELPGRGG